MGGEKCQSRFFWLSSRGSPPHGRGKVRQVGGFDGVAGITPTRAGKRARCPCWCAGGQDHPRVGGEKREWRPTRREKSGSSPRGRGKDPHPDVQGIVRGITPAWAGKRPGVKGALPPFRITPAWAGKSSRHCRWRSETRDHPRVGGEKRSDRLDYYFPQGSPPHGRGKAFQARSEHSHDRITPAWAGKSVSR